MAEYIEREAAIERIFHCPVLSSDAVSSENVAVWMAGVGDAKEQIRAMIKEVPSVDVAPVVRCRDCQFQHTLDCPMNYEVETYDEDDGWDSYMATNACHDDGFCWVGEKREER